MARPTKPKDLKPKVEGEIAAAPAAGGGGGGLDLKFIILVVVVLLSSVLGSAGSAYLMTTMFVMPELAKVGSAGGEHKEDPHAAAESHGNEVGMNLELDEFTVNLKADPNMEGTQYLRAKMALSIKVPEAEDCYAQAHHAMAIPVVIQGGKVVGAAASVDRETLASGGSSGPSCEDIFKQNMGKYVPTVRDVINSALMKKTASALATLEGQEALKDDIKDQLNPMLAPNYKVLRVNFQDFIIQK